MRSPAGDAMRAIKCEAVADPELARQIDDPFQTPRREALIALLRRGVERGEVRPEAACRTVADVLPAVLTYRIVIQREPLSEDDVTDDHRADLPAAHRARRALTARPGHRRAASDDRGARDSRGML